MPPAPEAFGGLGSSRRWFVDFVKDTQSGRALKELELPASRAVMEVLNGPCPPTLSLSALPTFGYGVDSISISCSGKRELIKFYLPTPGEILGEFLRESGVEPLPDEKRSAYLPAIRRFGGIYPAARAFSSVSRDILKSLYNARTRTPAESWGSGGCKMATCCVVPIVFPPAQGHCMLA